MSSQTPQNELLSLTTQIVSAHVSHNTVALPELQNLIAQVYKTLSGVGNETPQAPERPQPAVPIKKSVTDEHLICLECESPCYIFEFKSEQLIDALCEVCGNDDTDLFLPEEDFEGLTQS